MRKENLSHIAHTLQKLVLQTGRLLRRRLEDPHDVHYKNPNKKDMVTEMDREVEALFIRSVQRVFPDHTVLSEEMAVGQELAPLAKSASRFRWIVDPLDGTTNYVHGFPHFAVSAGVECEGRMVLGAVYNPMLRELFFAQRGKGAWRNGKRIRVSTTRALEEALLATGFPYDIWTSRENNFTDFYLMSMHSQAVRRPGSAALDICNVACGRFDGFWEYHLKPWDVAAGALLVQEAGGKITSGTSRGLDLFSGTFLVSNGFLHPAMTKVLAAARTCKSFKDLKKCYAAITARGE